MGICTTATPRCAAGRWICTARSTKSETINTRSRCAVRLFLRLAHQVREQVAHLLVFKFLQYVLRHQRDGRSAEFLDLFAGEADGLVVGKFERHGRLVM